MKFTSLLLRLLACSVVAYAAWRMAGPEGLVFSSLVFGVALARPIVDGIVNAFGLLRSWTYRDVEGRHFAYRGKSIDVVEDERHYRWLRLSDVRGILPGLPRDETLRSLVGPGVAAPESFPPRIKAEALHEVLAKASTLESVKFRIWIERTIIYPSAKVRAQREASVSPRGKRRSP